MNSGNHHAIDVTGLHRSQIEKALNEEPKSEADVFDVTSRRNPLPSAVLLIGWTSMAALLFMAGGHVALLFCTACIGVAAYHLLSLIAQRILEGTSYTRAQLVEILEKRQGVKDEG